MPCQLCGELFVVRTNGGAVNKYCSVICTRVASQKPRGKCKNCFADIPVERHSRSIYCGMRCSRLGRPPTRKRIPCKLCSRTFLETTSRGISRKYCSRKCSARRNKLPARKCMNCAKFFRTRHANGLFCSSSCFGKFSAKKRAKTSRVGICRSCGVQFIYQSKAMDGRRNFCEKSCYTWWERYGFSPHGEEAKVLRLLFSLKRVIRERREEHV
jgi:hypothetical protein